MRPFLFLWAALFAATTAGRAGPLQFASGPARTSLIELFTSEGCSSCPPAERWLGTLRTAPGLWRDFVPIAFHVDYWNRLGWPDRFSRPEFTRRESAYAAAWRNPSVYTPCFVRDGAEWRGGRDIAPSAAVARGVLTVSYESGVARADFAPAPGLVTGPWEVTVALLGAGVVSRVTAGENRGATLRHDFVALVLAHGAVGKPLALPRPPAEPGVRLALAAWVGRPGTLAPLQATGGWLE